MRIAILTEYYPDRANPASGVYVQLRARGYRDAGHDVRVYRPSVARGDASSDGPGERAAAGGRQASLAVSGRRRSDSAVPEPAAAIAVVRTGPAEAREDLLRFAPDVIALHTPYPGQPHVELADGADCPIVVWIHGYEAMITAFEGYHAGLARWLSVPHDLRKLWRLRRGLRRADGVVYVSDWIRRTTERNTRVRHGRARVIPNPVDTERFRPSEEPGSGSARSDTREPAPGPGSRDAEADPDAPEAATGPDSPEAAAGPDARKATTGAPGGVADPGGPAGGGLRGLVLRPLEREFGVDIAVRACAGLDSTHLTIVGVGSLAEPLRALARELDAPVEIDERRVPHADVPDLLRAYDYYVSPERKTPTQGVAMCEAMACGLPVVAVRAGGVPEYARSGTDGYLVDRDDPGALRAAVERLVGDPDRAREMGARARERVAATCAAAGVIGRELELLRKVAA